MKQVRTRIAPSPTGYPHIGTAYQALFDYVFAKKRNGKFVIRIEDTDAKRQVKESENVIYEGLEWLGLIPDEGPKYGGDFGPYRQSERLDIYKKHTDELVKKGNAYYCFCSPERLEKVREDQQKQGKPPMYGRRCRGLKPEEAEKKIKNESYVVRLRVPDNKTISFSDGIRGEIKFKSEVVDDQVLLKSDGYPTYHLAVVVDDHLMEITHVVRGEEWISSAPKHVLLYEYFGWQMPEFIHLPLLRNPDRSKVSKRHSHTSLFWYRDEGYLVEAVINFLATRVWNHPEGKEVFGLEELIKHFDFSKMHILGPIVDLDKLDWLNGQWIRQKTDKELMKDLELFRPKWLNRKTLMELLPLVKERLHKLSKIGELTEYFVREPRFDKKMFEEEAKHNDAEISDYLSKVIETVEESEWSVEGLEKSLRKLQEDSGWKPRPAFMTIRIAVTGQLHTPPLFDTMLAIGKENVITRLSHAKEKFS